MPNFEKSEATKETLSNFNIMVTSVNAAKPEALLRDASPSFEIAGGIKISEQQNCGFALYLKNGFKEATIEVQKRLDDARVFYATTPLDDPSMDDLESAITGIPINRIKKFNSDAVIEEIGASIPDVENEINVIRANSAVETLSGEDEITASSIMWEKIISTASTLSYTSLNIMAKK